MTTQQKLRRHNRRLQHKHELWCVTAGILVTYNMILSAMLFALTKTPISIILLLGVLGLLLAIVTRKWVLKTPEESLASEEKKDEQRYANRKDSASKDYGSR